MIKRRDGLLKVRVKAFCKYAVLLDTYEKTKDVDLKDIDLQKLLAGK